MKTLTVSFTILALALFTSPAIFAGEKTAETQADNSARAAKIARAKAKSRAKMKKEGKQKSSYGNTDKVVEDCGGSVDIGNVNTGGGRVTGNVTNEVIITGDVINISKGGCKN